MDWFLFLVALRFVKMGERGRILYSAELTWKYQWAAEVQTAGGCSLCKQHFDQLMSLNSHGCLFWDLERFMWKQLGWVKQQQQESKSSIYRGIGK